MENNEKMSFAEAWRLAVRAWRVWYKRCPAVIWATALKAVAEAATPYAAVWFSARIIAELAGARSPERLRFWVLCTLAVSAAMTLLNGSLTRWETFEMKRADQFDEHLYTEKLQDLDFADLDRQEVYDLHAQIQQSANWACWGTPKSLLELRELFKAAAQIIGGVALSFELLAYKVPSVSGFAWLDSPVCTVGFLALILALIVLSSKFIAMARKYFTEHSDDARFTNRAFRAYNYELPQDRGRALDVRLYRQVKNVVHALYKRVTFAWLPGSAIAKAASGPQGILYALGQACIALITVAVYLYVCLKAWAGAFGVGEVTQYVGALTQLFAGVAQLFDKLNDLHANGTFLKQCFKFLDLPNNMYMGSLTTEKRSDRKYTVEFRDVSFKYPDCEQYALRHVNMKFKIGSRLAVVGMNGSGKTTFIKLLCRLYDPTEGEILLNGIDIRKYRYDEYINIFSVVFQDFKLFAMPLGQNVAASAEYDAARVTDCLEKAGFADRLAELPHGLDTCLYKELDENGVEVSGGEAQKIAIARALYKDAPFIVLDEPTAALDPIAEAEIYSKFNDIAGDKTAIYISHRLSSCKFCDEIAVFDQGAVIQQGTHESLLADTKGKYYELWNAQAQYYTEEKADAV